MVYIDSSLSFSCKADLAKNGRAILTLKNSIRGPIKKTVHLEKLNELFVFKVYKKICLNGNYHSIPSIVSMLPSSLNFNSRNLTLRF